MSGNTREFIEREININLGDASQTIHNELHNHDTESLIEKLWIIKNRMSCNI